MLDSQAVDVYILVQRISHMRYATNISIAHLDSRSRTFALVALSSGQKRKSLPVPVSGSAWTRQMLEKLHIYIMPEDEKMVLRTGGLPEDMKLNLSGQPCILGM